MKKADNFDSSKWLVENKITFQSRLNEDMAKEKMYEVTVTHKITKRSSHVNVIATSEEEARKKVENSGMKLEDYYISSVVELYSEGLDESRLNENEIPGVNVDVDDDMITLSGDSGDYDGFIEDNGTVSFTVTNDEEDFNDQNWKDILGDDHTFVKIANTINTDVEALGDYVMITVKADDLTNINESKLNEDFEEAHEYLEISPEDFQPGDYFLMAPDEDGEFFEHKEKIKILSIDLPKDGRSDISKVKTEDGKIMGLSSTSLYDIARPL